MYAFLAAAALPPPAVCLPLLHAVMSFNVPCVWEAGEMLPPARRQ